MRFYVDDKTGCWIWSGPKTEKGYGLIYIGGKSYTVSRLVCAVFNGPIRSDQVATHKCDNPSCINPAHLQAGTQHDNLLDMSAKSRAARQNNEKPSPKTNATPRIEMPQREQDPDEVYTRYRPTFTDMVTRRKLRVARYKTGILFGGNAPGELHSTAKLSEQQAREILQSREKGALLAQRYGVSVATISKIRNGILWKHLGPVPETHTPQDGEIGAI